jgi:hypothetical protein
MNIQIIIVASLALSPNSSVSKEGKFLDSLLIILAIPSLKQKLSEYLSGNKLLPFPPKAYSNLMYLLRTNSEFNVSLC